MLWQGVFVSHVRPFARSLKQQRPSRRMAVPTYSLYDEARELTNAVRWTHAVGHAASLH